MAGSDARPRKVLQLCAVDFTLYHFLAPLVRAIGAAGESTT